MSRKPPNAGKKWEPAEVKQLERLAAQNTPTRRDRAETRAHRGIGSLESPGRKHLAQTDEPIALRHKQLNDRDAPRSPLRFNRVTPFSLALPSAFGGIRSYARHSSNHLHQQEQQIQRARAHLAGRWLRNGDQWTISQPEAIAGIEDGRWQFFVHAGGKSVWVIVAKSQFGHKYLKTQNDGEQPDNLLSLPECP